MAARKSSNRKPKRKVSETKKKTTKKKAGTKKVGFFSDFISKENKEVNKARDDKIQAASEGLSLKEWKAKQARKKATKKAKGI